MKFVSLILCLLFASELYACVDIPYRPWYSGPLIAVTSFNNAPGEFTINPFFYATHDYRESGTAPMNVYQGFLWLQTGLTKLIDLTVIGLYQSNRRRGHSDEGWGDTVVRLGFHFMKDDYQTARPSMRIIVQEQVPTGKYDALDPEKRGVDALGSGSYETRCVFVISKVLFWIKNHPIKPTLNLGATIPSKVHVSGFNNYGGGRGTRGTVSPGATLTADLACEFSFTQQFAATMEIVADYQFKTTFSGKKGVLRDGTVASNTARQNTVVSLAPGLEYNFTEDLYILGGAWFTISTNNSAPFVSGIVSLSYMF